MKEVGRQAPPQIAIMSDLHLDNDVSGRARCRKCGSIMSVRTFGETVTCPCGAACLAAGITNGSITMGDAEPLPGRPNWGGAVVKSDIVILAGDLHRGVNSVTWAATEFSGIPTLVVPGNREHYGADTQVTGNAMRVAAARSGTVSVLDNSTAEFEVRGYPVRILGTTLWTDFLLLEGAGLSRAEAMAAEDRKVEIRHVDPSMRITVSGTPFSASLMLKLHLEALDWLTYELHRPYRGMTVVATHHAPVAEGADRRFDGYPTQPSFASDLSALIVATAPDLVVWGHTHAPDKDFYLGSTRMVSRQRGYSHEAKSDFLPAIIDLAPR